MTSLSMDCVLASALVVNRQMATEAGRLVSYAKKSTLDARAIQTAARLVLPGELANHAVSVRHARVRDICLERRGQKLSPSTPTPADFAASSLPSVH